MIDELEELRVAIAQDTPPIHVELDLPASVQIGYHEAQKARVRDGNDIQTLKEYLQEEIMQLAMLGHWKRMGY